jgi:hypothetical protein
VVAAVARPAIQELDQMQGKLALQQVRQAVPEQILQAEQAVT